MQAKQKNRLKRTVDVCMTVLLLCLMAYQVTGETLHEWFGIGMTALLIAHHVLNGKWYAALLRGRYNLRRIVATAVNTLLLVSIALTALCGMSISSHAVPFLYGMLPAAFARQFHLAMSYWSFLLMGVHLGLHIPAMTAGFHWSARASYAAAAAFTVLSGVGLWLFVRNGIPGYLFFRTPFAFLDYNKAAVLVFLENLAILTAFAFLGAQTASFIQAAQSKGDARKFRTFLTALLVAAALLICASLGICTALRQETASPKSADASAAQTQDAPSSADPAAVGDGFLLLDGGTFMMGSSETENWRVGDETQHEVTVSPFYIDPYETTQAEYARLMSENPRAFSCRSASISTSRAGSAARR